MTVTAPPFVAATTSSIKDLVPFSNVAISKTPMGPFQMMVLLAFTVAAFFTIDSGPQSRPMKPAGTPLATLPAFTSPSSPNFDEQTKSTGSTISTPFALAFSIISPTILEPSSSKREFPMSMPLMTFKKVNAMPPPMIILSTLSSKFLISRILSLTLAPPRMARSGRCGLSKTFANASSSFCINHPDALMGKPSPTMELCARWAVPKASLM
mmetsp:Transcript_30094/g.54694  ORF Transcript_30094/g.54694 Transcript_30094/m.54694 type:complete len:211 (+) Transcript_30094:952-1584(+)